MIDLTERQWQIAMLIAGGKNVRQISDELGISLWTVKGHVRKICRRLGVSRMHEIPEAMEACSRGVRAVESLP